MSAWYSISSIENFKVYSKHSCEINMKGKEMQGNCNLVILIEIQRRKKNIFIDDGVTRSVLVEAFSIQI